MGIFHISGTETKSLENQKVMPHGSNSLAFGIQACLNAFVSDTLQ